MKIKANVKKMGTINFEVENSIPQFINGHEFTGITQLILDVEQPRTENWDYNFYEVVAKFIECGEELEEVKYICIKEVFEEEEDILLEKYEYKILTLDEFNELIYSDLVKNYDDNGNSGLHDNTTWITVYTQNGLEFNVYVKSEDEDDEI